MHARAVTGAQNAALRHGRKTKRTNLIADRRHHRGSRARGDEHLLTVHIRRFGGTRTGWCSIGRREHFNSRDEPIKVATAKRPRRDLKNPNCLYLRVGSK